LLLVSVVFSTTVPLCSEYLCMWYQPKPNVGVWQITGLRRIGRTHPRISDYIQCIRRVPDRVSRKVSGKKIQLSSFTHCFEMTRSSWW
jgi:hypothetical protein